ncbi:MAG: hypothetical protein HKN76_19895 [Saprospiraceae bacterium]|nr:hypothetical protein [Saprospiraceae bacterium]
MKNNRGYSTLEKNDEVGGFDIVRYEAESGARAVLVSAKKLIPLGDANPFQSLIINGQ